MKLSMSAYIDHKRGPHVKVISHQQSWMAKLLAGPGCGLYESRGKRQNTSGQERYTSATRVSLVERDEVPT
jgi:hypothetical protein